MMNEKKKISVFLEGTETLCGAAWRKPTTVFEVENAIKQALGLPPTTRILIKDRDGDFIVITPQFPLNEAYCVFY